MDQRLAFLGQRGVLAAALLIPIIWSAVCGAWSATPARVSPGAPIQSLAFHQYSVNLREVGLLPVLEGRYFFKNLGAGPLRITDLEPSCGCLRPKLAEDKKLYQPGEIGHFVVGVATANESPGPHTYTVKVRYTDPQPHAAVVSFKLTLPERKLSIEPPELAFYQYSGTPGTKTVYLTDYRGSQLDVTQAVTTADFIDVEVQKPETDEHGNARIPILLHVPATVPPGRTVTNLTIETTDPEFKTIFVPVMVDGPTDRMRREILSGPPAPHTP